MGELRKIISTFGEQRLIEIVPERASEIGSSPNENQNSSILLCFVKSSLDVSSSSP